MISVTAANNRLYSLQLWKIELGLNYLTKIKRWRNFTYVGLLATQKIVGNAYILLHMRGEIYITVLIGLYKCNYYVILL